jgi:hypothetical protein
MPEAVPHFFGLRIVRERSWRRKDWQLHAMSSKRAPNVTAMITETLLFGELSSPDGRG